MVALLYSHDYLIRMKNLILIFLLIFVSELSFAVTTTWDGSSSTDWETAGNWDNGVPGTGDDVIIPDISGASGNFPVFSGSSNINCQDLTINSGATLTLNGTSSAALNVYGDIVVNGTINGSFNMLRLYGGTGAISGTPTDVTGVELYSRGGSVYTLNSDWSIYELETQDVGSTFNVASGVTLTISNRMYNRTDCSVILLGTANLDLNGGPNIIPEANSTFTMNSGTLYINSTFLGGNTSATFNTGTGTVVLDGSDNCEIRIAYTFNNLTIAKDATDDIVTCQDAADDITVNGNLVITEGTLQPTLADLDVTGTTTITDGELIGGAALIYLRDNITMDNDAYMTMNTDGSSLRFYGNLTMNGTSGLRNTGGATQTFIPIGTTTQTISCNTPANSSSAYIFTGFSNWDIDLSTSWTVAQFTMGSNTGTPDFSVADGATFSVTGNFANNSSGVTSTLTLAGTGSLDVGGNFTNASTVAIGTGTISIEGNFTNSGTFDGASGTVTFDGSANSVIDDPDGIGFYNLTLNKTATDDIVSCNDLDADITVANNLTITEGTLSNGTADLSVTGSTTINGGNLTLGSSTSTPVFTGDLTVNASGTLTLDQSDNDKTLRINSDLVVNGTVNGSNCVIRPNGTSKSISGTPTDVSGLELYPRFGSSYTLNSNWSIDRLQTQDVGTTFNVADGVTLTTNYLYNRTDCTINLLLSANMDVNGLAGIIPEANSSFVMGSGNLYVNNTYFGGLTPANFTTGTGTVVLDGSTNTELRAAFTFNNLTIVMDATDDVVSCQAADDDITVNGALTITEGTLSTTAADLSVTGTTTITDGKLIAASGGTTAKTTLTGDLTMNNDAILDDQTSITTASSDAIDLYGSLDLNGTSSITSTTLSSATINLRGGTKTINAEVGVTCSLADMNFYEDYTIQDNWTVRGLYAWSSTGVITLADGVTVTADDLYNNTDGTITLTGSAGLTITDDAWLCIESGTTFTMNTGTVDIADRLQIGSGANGTFNGNSGTVQVGGDLVMAGTVNEGTTTFELDGSVNQNISGATVKWHDLVIKNTSGDVDLNADGTVNGTLTMSTGDLVIATGITLTSDGTDAPGFSGGSTSAHIVTSGTGTISDTYASTTKVTYPVGDGTLYRPIALTPNSTNSTVWTIAYAASAHADSDVSGDLDHVSYDEYWTCDRSGGTPADAVMELTWHSASQVNTLADLTIAHYDGTTDWDEVASTAIGSTTSGVITSDAVVTSFSPFTLASKSAQNPLPVELLTFDAKLNEEIVELTWATASEINNDFFEVLHSVDGLSWKLIDVIDGSGNSTFTIDYSTNHYSPAKNINYYRLRQVDFDGSYEYSAVQTVTVQSANLITISPNPSTGVFFINGLQRQSAIAVVNNSIGQIVIAKQLQNGSIDLSHLPKGMYVLSVENHTERIIID